MYQFQGGNIRYNLAESEGTTTKDEPRMKCVVFVHGTLWSSVVYRSTVEALLAKGSYNILVYDLPGYGQTQEYHPGDSTTTSEADFPGDTSVKFQAKALAALLKQVQLDGKERHSAPAVITHDIAGTIVLRAHLLEGCEFDTMMLIDANIVLPWGDGFYNLARSEAQTFLKLPPDVFGAVVRAVVRSACHNPKVLQTGWEDLLARPWIDSSSDGGTATGQRSFVRQIAQANDAYSHTKVTCKRDPQNLYSLPYISPTNLLPLPSFPTSLPLSPSPSNQSPQNNNARPTHHAHPPHPPPHKPHPSPLPPQRHRSLRRLPRRPQHLRQ